MLCRLASALAGLGHFRGMSSASVINNGFSGHSFSSVEQHLRRLTASEFQFICLVGCNRVARVQPVAVQLQSAFSDVNLSVSPRTERMFDVVPGFRSRKRT